jgi:hypothetical protein
MLAGSVRLLPVFLLLRAAYPASTDTWMRMSAGQVPLVFEANQGQMDSRLRFVARGVGYSLFLTGDEAVFRTRDRLLRLRFEGASAQAQVIGEEVLPGKSNYYLGRSSHRAIAAYRRVRVRQIYPGIDLIFHGRQQQLEFDFLLAPRADAGRIRMRVDGADSLRATPSGDVIATSGRRALHFGKPTVYQEIDGRRQPVRGEMHRAGKHGLRLRLGPYDHSRELIVDPVLAYAVPLGGGSFNYPTSVAADSGGNVYVAGATCSADFPTTANAIQRNGHPDSLSCEDVFVMKVDPAGSSLLYSTYLGGAASDAALRIAVDAAGAAYITGLTQSADFPITANAPIPALDYSCHLLGEICPHAFVAKLSPDGGALVYSTLLGGEALDIGTGIAVDASGSAYIAGITNSSSFPTTPGALQTTWGGGATCLTGFTPCADAFVSKLSPDGGSFVYSTYLGGVLTDYAGGIAVDAQGSAYVVGCTRSPAFPTTPGAYQQARSDPGDAFVAKLSPDGSSLIYATTIGGTGPEFAHAVTVDTTGAAYVAGSTASPDFPVTPGAFQTTFSGPENAYHTCIGRRPPTCGDGFVAKVTPDGSGLVFATYLGGADIEGMFNVTLDGAGNIWVTGNSRSRDFPTTSDAYYKTGGAFVTSLSGDGSKLLFSSTMGPSSDTGVGLTTDSSGNVYAAGLGPTPPLGAVFPTTGSGYLAKFTPGSQRPALQLTPTFLGFGSPAQAVGITSAPQTVTLSNSGNGDAPISIYIDTFGFSDTGVDTGDYAETDNCGAVLPAGKSCTIAITFQPRTTNSPGARLVVASPAPNSPFTVMLQGLGDLPPTAAVTPPSVVFSGRPVGSTSASELVSLIARSNAQFNATGATLTGPNASDFIIQSSNCQGKLVGCNTNVAFKPTALGARTATLNLGDDALGGPHTVALSGTGSNGPAAYIASFNRVISFLPVNVGATGSQLEVLNNTGGAPMHVTRVDTTDDFSASLDSGCASVASQASCLVNLVFKPATAGFHSGTLKITDDSPDSPQTVQLTGVAMNGTDAAIIISTDLAPDFGSVVVGSASNPINVNIRNTGQGAATVAVTVTGDLHVTSDCPPSLPAGSFCAAIVTFVPTKAGPDGGVFTLTTSAPGAQQTIMFAGVGLDAPGSIQLSTTGVDFGAQTIGHASVAQAVNIKNPGKAVLSLNGIATAAPFAQTNDCGSAVPAGAACTLRIIFTPAAGGRASGVVTITEASGVAHTVTLRGYGTSGPSTSAQPQSLNFGTQAVGSSSMQSITLTSTGDAPLVIAGITAQGDFAQTNNCPATLVPGASCVVNVSFTPSLPGGRSGVIVVTYGGGGPLVVGLSGVGR